uniref:Uncharacterized protein n=1 Tax=Arundo donax TaxID=35708 RepID=A0A0A8Z0E8_ARUDO
MGGPWTLLLITPCSVSGMPMFVCTNFQTAKVCGDGYYS